MKQLGAGSGNRTRIFSLEGTYFARDFKDLGAKRVPGAPDFILGVVSRRGEILPVIDLSKFMKLPQTQQCNNLIFIEALGFSIGIAVHKLKEIARLMQDSIKSLQSQLSGEQAQYLSGVTESGMALLDVEELLSNTRLNIDQQ